MRIAYISLIRLPTDRAHGYAVMKMCEEFARAGASVELFVPRRTHGRQADPFDYYQIERNFSIKKLWATDFLGRIEGSRFAFALDQGTFLLSLRRMRFDDELVYTRDYQVALCVRARRIAIEVHSIPERTRYFLKALSRAERVIVISEGLRQSLVGLGVPESKILVAPDAVDLKEFAIEPSREIWDTHHVDHTKKIILYTGHFYGWKGADTLARAASFLPQERHIVLMGGVDQELSRFTKAFSDARVHVIGHQPREMIPRYLTAADVLVLPNSAKPKISSHYTSPLKLFQYMASGVPIVASDLPSIREILSNDTAFWFTPDDEQALADEIEYVLAHPQEAQARAARAKAEVKKYTWDARAKNILNHISV